MTTKTKLGALSAGVMLVAIGVVATSGASTRTATIQLSDGEVGSAEAQCPAGKRAVLGGVEAEYGPASRVIVGELSRPSKRTIRASGYNPDSAEGDLTAIATCKRQPKSRPSAETVAVDDEPATAITRCPKGRRIAFGGFIGDVTRFDAFAIPTAARAETSRRWAVSSTDSGEPGELTAIAYCGKAAKTKEHSESTSVDPGFEATATARCKRRERFAFGGFDVTGPDSDPYNLRLTELVRSGRRKWNVGAYNDGFEAAEVFAFAYCVPKKS